MSGEDVTEQKEGKTKKCAIPVGLNGLAVEFGNGFGLVFGTGKEQFKGLV